VCQLAHWPAHKAECTQAGKAKDAKKDKRRMETYYTICTERRGYDRISIASIVSEIIMQIFHFEAALII
jgi:hypothetical protein